ncbi:MAG TPA: hypothetical protein DCG38_04405 [Eubacteriaceae bacterium]|jgi:hypothetical protein|nr:hypothetical protein [Eubacteriaceae bacterium]
MDQTINKSKLLISIKERIDEYLKAEGILKLISVPLLMDAIFMNCVLVIKASSVFYKLCIKGGLPLFFTGIPIGASFFLIYIGMLYVGLPRKIIGVLEKNGRASPGKKRWIITLGVMLSFRIFIAIILSIYDSVL